jgi:hypothetical protein
MHYVFLVPKRSIKASLAIHLLKIFVIPKRVGFRQILLLPFNGSGQVLYIANAFPFQQHIIIIIIIIKIIFPF